MYKLPSNPGLEKSESRTPTIRSSGLWSSSLSQSPLHPQTAFLENVFLFKESQTLVRQMQVLKRGSSQWAFYYIVSFSLSFAVKLSHNNAFLSTGFSQEQL